MNFETTNFNVFRIDFDLKKNQIQTKKSRMNTNKKKKKKIVQPFCVSLHISTSTSHYTMYECGACMPNHTQHSHLSTSKSIHLLYYEFRTKLERVCSCCCRRFVKYSVHRVGHTNAQEVNRAIGKWNWFSSRFTIFRCPSSMCVCVCL